MENAVHDTLITLSFIDETGLIWIDLESITTLYGFDSDADHTFTIIKDSREYINETGILKLIISDVTLMRFFVEKVFTKIRRLRNDHDLNELKRTLLIEHSSNILEIINELQNYSLEMAFKH